VTESGIGRDGAAAVAAGTFPRLAHLVVARMPAGDVTAGLATGAARLATLELREGGLTDADLVRMVDGRSWTRLRVLDVSGNRLTPAGLSAVVASRRWPKLERLVVTGNPTPTAALPAAALAARNRVGVRLTCGELQAARFRQPDGRWHLSVWGRSPAAGLLSGLPASPAIGDLASLTVSGVRLAPDDLAPLADPTFANLEVLQLLGTKLGNAGVAALVGHLTGGRLEELNLSSNGIGAAGAKALAGWPGLASVKVLDLRGNPITLGGAEALADSPYRGKLRSVNLGNLKASADRLAALRERFGAKVKVVV
jgi:hypothetical protein